MAGFNCGNAEFSCKSACLRLPFINCTVHVSFSHTMGDLRSFSQADKTTRTPVGCFDFHICQAVIELTIEGTVRCCVTCESAQSPVSGYFSRSCTILVSRAAVHSDESAAVIDSGDVDILHFAVGSLYTVSVSQHSTGRSAVFTRSLDPYRAAGYRDTAEFHSAAFIGHDESGQDTVVRLHQSITFVVYAAACDRQILHTALHPGAGAANVSKETSAVLIVSLIHYQSGYLLSVSVKISAKWFVGGAAAFHPLIQTDGYPAVIFQIQIVLQSEILPDILLSACHILGQLRQLLCGRYLVWIVRASGPACKTVRCVVVPPCGWNGAFTVCR